MKKIFLTLLIIITSFGFAFSQSPSGFNYQGVARDASGDPYQKSVIGLRISLLRDGESGSIDYTERHIVSTTDLGVFSLKVGTGTVLGGTFTSLDWGKYSYFLKVDMDVAGGTDYESMGVSKLLSVPYAMYALESGSGGGSGTDNQQLNFDINTSMLSITNGNSIVLPAGKDGQDGNPGPQGPQGLRGPAGAGVKIVGSVGNTGQLNTNYTGAIGDMYISQNDGHGHVWNGSGWDDVGQIKGPKGDQGIKGDQGAQGIQGPKGEQGITGPEGNQGSQGPQGINGEKGDQGIKGPAGAGVQIIGSVSNATDLQSNYGGATGDMYISQNNGHGHVWNGNSWDDVGQIRGPQGEQGPSGGVGSQGIQGSKGDQGNVGPIGPKGDTGITGSQGPNGDKGDQGGKGNQGDKGPIGSQGVQGPAGPAGAGVQIIGSVASPSNLSNSYSGSVGDMFITQNNGHGHVWNGNGWDDVGQIRGPQGEQGPQGSQGVQGNIGATGPQGDKGNPGNLGATGQQGPQGLKGAQGASGSQGAQGPKGDQGTKGDKGVAGNNGSTGSTGPAGSQGSKGDKGVTGNNGPTGPTGPKGDKGVKGDQGDTGPAGSGSNYTAGSGITISGSTISAMDDSDVNELQNLSLSFDNYLSLSGTNGSVLLPSSKWGQNGSNLYYNNGNVGIGTDSPTANLSIASASLVPASLLIQNSVPLKLVSGLSSGSISTGSYPMYLSTGGANRVLITENGDVGINTNPEASFHTYGDIIFDNGDISHRDLAGNKWRYQTNGDSYLFARKSTSGSWVDLYQVNSNGNFEIIDGNLSVGTYEDDTDVHIRQGPLNSYSENGVRVENDDLNYWTTCIDASHDYVFSYNGSPKSWVKPDGTYFTPSDQRLKNSVQAVGSVLDKLNQLSLSTYFYTANVRQDVRSWGFIAQEVEQLFPDFVTEKNGFKALAYQNFGLLAIKGIQEQNEIIKSQATKIEKLEGRLERLEKLLLKKLEVETE